MIVQGRQPVQVNPPVTAGMARIGLGESASGVLAASAPSEPPPATSTQRPPLSQRGLGISARASLPRDVSTGIP